MEITGYTDKNGIDIPLNAIVKHEDGSYYPFKKDNGVLVLYNCNGDVKDHTKIDFSKSEL